MTVQAPTTAGQLMETAREILDDLGATALVTGSKGVRDQSSPVTGSKGAADLAVIGPAGSGKTTMLAKMAEAFARAGVSWCATSFSRAAIAAFTEKAPGIDPPVRTIYSWAHRALGLRVATGYINLRDEQTVRDLAQLGIRVRAPQGEPEEPEASESALARALDLLRHADHLTAAEVCGRLHGLDMAPARVQGLRQRYDTYLRERDRVDHAALLEKAARVAHGSPPAVVFCDEAQDLTPLEWRAFDTLANGAQLRVLVGDPAQAVHGWRGVRYQEFPERVSACAVAYQLRKTWRNPQWVVGYADRILRRIPGLPQRLTVRAASRRGVVRAYPSLAPIVELIRRGEEAETWLILGRNRKYLRGAARELAAAGIVFGSSGGLRLGMPEQAEGWTDRGGVSWTLAANGFPAMARLARGEELSPVEWSGLLRLLRPRAKSKGELAPEAASEIRAGRGSKWFYGVGKPRAQRIDGWVELHGLGVLERTPRVTLLTIHGSKGLEADQVVVLGDWSRASRRGIGRPGSGEHQLAYVALTRCRQGVYLVDPRSGSGYPWPPIRLEQAECGLL